MHTQGGLSRCLFQAPRNSKHMEIGTPLGSTSEAVAVDFVEGKFGKMLPVVVSFVFYPKDKERVRFACKTGGCNASICVERDGGGNLVVFGKPTHNHPDLAQTIKNLVHIQRMREEFRDEHNTYVPTRTIVSAIRNETKTCRRKSVDCRLARRIRRKGPCPRSAEEIRVTPALSENSIYISDDKGVIVMAREWGIRLASRAERVCVDGTFRCVPATHYQMLTFHVMCRNGSSFPVIHAILKDKSCVSYTAVLNAVQHYATRLGW